MAKKKQHQEAEGPATVASIEHISLSELRGSPTNPRKTYPEKELAELAGSIKKHGVINPITIRPIFESEPSNRSLPPGIEYYEVVSGHRRFKASQIAGLETIPCIVRDLDDDQVLDIQIAENLHRQDVPPLEEAAGFQMMIDTGRVTIDELAGKIGKSARYVYRRLKLNNLQEDYRAHVESGALPATTAELLASYPQEAQAAVFKKTFWQLSDEIRFDSAPRIKAMLEVESCKKLNRAIFPLDKDNMQPGLVSCTRCPKNTAVATLLFPDGEDNPQCTDKSCWKVKEAVHIALTVSEWEAYCAANNVEPKYLDLYYFMGDEKKNVENIIGRDLETLSKYAYERVDKGTPGAFEVMMVGGSSWGDEPNESYTRGWVRENENRRGGADNGDYEIRAIENNPDLSREEKDIAIAQLLEKRVESKRRYDEMQFQKLWKLNIVKALHATNIDTWSMDFLRVYVLAIDFDDYHLRRKWYTWFGNFAKDWKPLSFAKQVLLIENAEWNAIVQDVWDKMLNGEENDSGFKVEIDDVWNNLAKDERRDFIQKIGRESKVEELIPVVMKIWMEEMFQSENNYNGCLTRVSDYETMVSNFLGKEIDDFKPSDRQTEPEAYAAADDEFDPDWDAEDDED